jgi:hypothetical protein
MIRIPSHMKVELKPLRKNAVKGHYRVLELDNDGMVSKVSTYETIREAIYHAATNRNGDIISVGAPRGSKLKAFYCKHYNRMAFGVIGISL